jgi:hypothetical protein
LDSARPMAFRRSLRSEISTPVSDRVRLQSINAKREHTNCNSVIRSVNGEYFIKS